MSTNRPFMSNFLAAFRAHTSALPNAKPSLITSSNAVVASAQAAWSSAAYGTASITSSQQQQQQPPQQQQQQQQSIETTAVPRPIETRKPLQPSISTSPSTQIAPTPIYPAYTPLQHNVTPRTHGTLSPSSPTGVFPTCQEARRNRRGSDSSSDGGLGFRDTTGREKWYIGGRTAGGEERYYKLSMARRDTSADRLSADRMSL